jgi:carbon starvation protein
MGLVTVVLASAVVLLIAYFTYGSLLVRLLRLDPKAETPAVELRDDLDYEPIAASTLFPQHFSAIAAAGPIAGPIFAGLLFGWLPALLWILIGSVFIGGMHDLTALIASVRHKARSIAEVVRDHMSPLSYILFLSFIWIALVYIIVAFADMTAGAFVDRPTKDGNIEYVSRGVATSSLLYLIFPVVMGLLMRYARMPLWLATVIFVPLIGAAIWIGQLMPLDLQGALNVSPEVAKRIWAVLLLIYCVVAAIVPVWLLLQPRGHLGGYFLYVALGVGVLGILFGGLSIEYPALIPWDEQTKPLFPVLFITVACGACSGFHSLIASGTTSKQLRKETDAKSVGYGAMLLEGLVAVLSLCCVMMFARGALELSSGSPEKIYAAGLGRFGQVLFGEQAGGYIRAFASLAFATFIYDTLDVCTRLGRFIVQELTKQHGWFGKTLGTVLTAGAPLFFILRHPLDSPQEVYKVFWNLFGASNQLLAALTLIGITVWLWKTRRAMWVWPVVGLPAAWMYTMSTWALANMTYNDLRKDGEFVNFLANPVPYIGLVLLGLAVVMLIEAIRVLLLTGSPSPPQPKAQPALAGA